MHTIFEPAHEIIALFALCKLILQTHMRSHPVGLDVWCLIGPFVYFHTSCVWTAKALVRLRMRRLTWAFAGRLSDKHHNLMSWLIYLFSGYHLTCANILLMKLILFLEYRAIVVPVAKVLSIRPQKRDWNAGIVDTQKTVWISLKTKLKELASFSQMALNCYSKKITKVDYCLNISLTIPNLVPQMRISFFNFVRVA